jgi:histone H1/5
VTPAEKARIAGRKEAVKSGTSKGLSAKEARKRYYVRTRAAELEKKTGKPVSAEKRKQLREKFNSGDVSRKGFAAPKKKSVSSSSSVLADKPVSSTKGKSPTSQMQSVPGYKSGSAKPAGKSSDKKSSSSSGGLKGIAKSAYRSALKGSDWVNRELLGIDDFNRAIDYTKKGNYRKAAKSAGAGTFESAATIGALLSGGASATGKTALKTAVQSRAKSGLRPIAGLKSNRPGALGTSRTRSLMSSPAKAASKKPAVKKPSVKKPPAKKPAVKKPAAKKPVAKKPVAKKPVTKRPPPRIDTLEDAIKWARQGFPQVPRAARKKS